MVMQTWLFVLAGAQHRTRVSIHHTTLTITHHHTSVTTPDTANLPKFTEYVHREMSKALNVLLASQRYEAPGQIFEDRQTHQMRLLDAPACMSHVMYERLNCVAAGLVERPHQMPDCRFDFGRWHGEPLVVKRPPFYFNPKTTEPERELHFEVDPLTFLEFSGDIDRIVHHFRKAERLATQSFRQARRFRVIGTKRLRRIHPYNEPRTRREPSRQLIPTFKVGARGITGRSIRSRACQEVSAFRKAHADANAVRRVEGSASYPAGTYKMRLLHDVSVLEASPDAIITAPGVTLDEATELVGVRRPSETTVPEQVSAAFDEEAERVLDEDRFTFSRADTTPATVDVEHVQSAVRNSCASRVVVLRDYRRGRPRKPQGREPPE